MVAQDVTYPPFPDSLQRKIEIVHPKTVFLVKVVVGGDGQECQKVAGKSTQKEIPVSGGQSGQKKHDHQKGVYEKIAGVYGLLWQTWQHLHDFLFEGFIESVFFKGERGVSFLRGLPHEVFFEYLFWSTGQMVYLECFCDI